MTDLHNDSSCGKATALYYMYIPMHSYQIPNQRVSYIYRDSFLSVSQNKKKYMLGNFLHQDLGFNQFMNI